MIIEKNTTKITLNDVRDQGCNIQNEWTREITEGSKKKGKDCEQNESGEKFLYLRMSTSRLVVVSK